MKKTQEYARNLTQMRENYQIEAGSFNYLTCEELTILIDKLTVKFEMNFSIALVRCGLTREKWRELQRYALKGRGKKYKTTQENRIKQNKCPYCNKFLDFRAIANGDVVCSDCRESEELDRILQGMTP